MISKSAASCALADRSGAASKAAFPPHAPAPKYEIHGTGEEGEFEIPVGPVHAGIIEPGHFRFTCFGETVVRLEDRLGYVHKGIEALMAGAEVMAMLRGFDIDRNLNTFHYRVKK